MVMGLDLETLSSDDFPLYALFLETWSATSASAVKGFGRE
jgi:hypothetical protein